jgi:hypothetical protein
VLLDRQHEHGDRQGIAVAHVAAGRTGPRPAKRRRKAMAAVAAVRAGSPRGHNLSIDPLITTSTASDTGHPLRSSGRRWRLQRRFAATANPERRPKDGPAPPAFSPRGVTRTAGFLRPVAAKCCPCLERAALQTVEGTNPVSGGRSCPPVFCRFPSPNRAQAASR